MNTSGNGEKNRPHRILVVDDARSVQNLLVRILESEGFRVQVAGNGKEALAELRKEDFDLVITDIAMPVMDGLTLTREIAETQPLDVIVITGKISQFSYDQVVSLGASDYVEKPFSPEEILLRVRRVLFERDLKSEATRLQQEKEQVSRFEAIGQLAAGIAHEINTPTQYIGDNVQFIGESFGEILELVERLKKAILDRGDPELERVLDRAAREADLDFIRREIPLAVEQTREGVDRIKQIIRAMKGFSHPGSDEHTMANLNNCIESTVVISKNEWKYIADLELDLDDHLPEIRCNPGELNQVFLNLIVNACHAIEDKIVSPSGQKGRIRIHTRTVEGGVEVAVADSGTGIPEDLVGRIFDPFFTTKEIGKGTGQGLAIARAIVTQRHRGKIEVETHPGQGTRFVIRLPLEG